MLKSLSILWGIIIFSSPYVCAQNNKPSLDLKFDRTQTIQLGKKKIRINGPFVIASDGDKAIAVGSKQNELALPAEILVGKTGTIIFTFMTKSRRPENELRNRMLLTLRGQDRERVYFYQAGSETLYFAFKNFTDPQTLKSIKPIKFDRWYQAACTWDGSTVKYFLDGVLQGECQQPYVPKFPEGSSFLYLGSYIDGYTNPEPWGEDSCLIRDLKVYKRAMSMKEIIEATGKKTVDASKKFGPFLAVPKVAVAPVMDGELSDDAWQRASSMVTLIDGQKPEESFSYKNNNPKFSHDGNNLYVGFSSRFPATYKLLKGKLRGDKEPEVWADESFEFYLNISGKLYRFGGNVAGGYCESLNSDKSFNGNWLYKTKTNMQIDNTILWQGEICIPFKTLGISKPVGSEIKINFCRTWRSLERIGITGMTGGECYDKKDLFATLKISGSDTAFQEVSVNNPNFGTLKQNLQAFSSKNTKLRYTVKLLLSSGFAPERALAERTEIIKAGVIKQFAVNDRIKNSSYDRLLFQVKDTTNSELLMQQVVPFKVMKNYLDVVPVLSASKVYLKPRYTLVMDKTGGNSVQLELITPANKTIFTRTITSDKEIAVPFARNNKAGTYHAVIFSMIGGKKRIFTSKTFNYHGIGPWEKYTSNKRVLSPFKPLTVSGDNGNFDVGMWGRIYQYRASLLPTTITALKHPVLAASSLMINGRKVNNRLKMVKSTPCRVEFKGKVNSAGYDLSQDTWIEYDGVMWNSITIKAKTDLSNIKLKLEIPKSMAKFYHATAAGFGAGGGRTGVIDKNMALPFWPIVWIGSHEQGLTWFAESKAAWKTSDVNPLKIVKNSNYTFLEVKFADTLAKGKDIKIEFGLVATPVKPLPKNYPLNVFGDNWAVHLKSKTTKVPVTAVCLFPETLGAGFYDLPLNGPSPNAELKRIKKEIERCDKDNVTFILYQIAVGIPEEYPVVRDNLREWQRSPANHLPYYEPRNGKSGIIYNICPASIGADYFIYKFKEMVNKIKLKGVYFDFGTANPCSNRYHGCNGNYQILAKRKFYKRIAEVLADANDGKYTIVVHNSESVQVPVFTFVTHFFNGEGLRQLSSNVFHNGKDILDHYTITDFASEHSSLPWGITSSMYIPTDPLLAKFGGDKEEGGANSPQEKYKFRMTKATMAGALIHNTIPSSSRLHYGWFDKVIRFYDAFGVPQAEFMPYWRNSEYVKVLKGKDIYVSFYRHPDKKELLVVVSHISKEHLDQDVEIRFNLKKLGFKKLTSATELLTGPDPEYKHLYKDVPDTKSYSPRSRWRIPVKLGDFGVEFEGLHNDEIKLKLKHHSVALVKIKAE